jgi:hypothetical protein
MFIQVCLSRFMTLLVLSSMTGCSYNQGGPAKKIVSNETFQQTNLSQQKQANNASKSNDEEQNRSLKIIKKDGWTIPGLKQSEIKKPRHSNDSVSGQKIFFTVLEPKQDVITEFAPDTLQQKAPLLLNKKWLVDSITQYDINNRIFCYKVFLSIVDTNVSGEVNTRYGASTAIVYYDEDGDGKFETLDLEDNLARPRIPQWLQNTEK